MNEEELKKGCGKEFYTHDRIILVKCGTECKHDKRKSNQIHLCPTCQAKLLQRPEDDRWDKEYNPDLLPETLKNKEEKQNE